MGKELEGRVALVTGGASGIGRSCALRLAGAGARVVVADLNAEGGQAVGKEIEARGGQALVCEVDVTLPADNQRMVEQAVGQFGALHAAHLNAGIGIASNVLDGALDDWHRVLAVNLTGVFLGLQAVAPAMREAGGGSIVATASVAGLRGGTGMASYYASKHGVVGLVKAAAMELAPLGIRVNAICPGVIDTPILGPLHGNPDFLEGPIAKLHPIGRAGVPEEVAELVLFLLEERSGFITGGAYPIDGGITATFGMPQSTAIPTEL